MSTHIETPSVTFAMTQDEFHLLATFMAPLRFDENQGQSVWVASRLDGGRVWTAHADGITSSVEIGPDPAITEGDDKLWCYPIPENLLVTIGKIFLTFDEVIVTLSDATATIATEEISITVDQNPRAKVPAIPPTNKSVCAATVDASNLWVVLSAARMSPAGGDGNGMNPPMVCEFDIDTKTLRFSVDWDAIGLGVHQFSTTAQFSEPTYGAMLPRFNFPHSAVLEVLRDPIAARRMGNVVLHASNVGEGYLLIEGEGWKLHVPALPNVAHWGHDLDEVIGGIDYQWEDCSLVHVLSPDLDHGVIELRALPDNGDNGPFKYRVSYEVLDDVIPTIDLYQELNSLNEGVPGCRLVVEGSRIVAVTDLTQENYEQLAAHVTAFARKVSDLPPLLGALDGLR
jgi:hypothetical protein